MQNAVRNSKKPMENSNRRIRSLVKELEKLYNECPRLYQRLSMNDGFLFSEIALASRFGSEPIK